MCTLERGKVKEKRIGRLVVGVLLLTLLGAPTLAAAVSSETPFFNPFTLRPETRTLGMNPATVQRPSRATIQVGNVRIVAIGNNGLTIRLRNSAIRIPEPLTVLSHSVPGPE